MKTEKEKAEAFVRSKIPELMKPTFGCYYKIKDPTASEGNRHREYVEYRSHADGWIARFKPENELVIIGHPIQLHHWLSVLADKIRATHLSEAGLVIYPNVDASGRFVFELSTGQPASEADYKALCTIFEI